jgi:hypothetical protein
MTEFEKGRQFVRALGFQNKREYQCFAKQYNDSTDDEQTKLIARQINRSAPNLTPSQLQARMELFGGQEN